MTTEEKPRCNWPRPDEMLDGLSLSAFRVYIRYVAEYYGWQAGLSFELDRQLYGVPDEATSEETLLEAGREQAKTILLLCSVLCGPEAPACDDRVSDAMSRLDQAYDAGWDAGRRWGQAGHHR